MSIRFDDLQQNRFEEDLQLASGFKPLTDKDLKDAYARYKDVGVKKGLVKGKSDTQLYEKATADVIAWWKLNKKRESDAKKAADRAAKRAAQDRAVAARRAAEAAARSGSSGGVGSSGGGAPSGGFLLPDTSMVRAKSTEPRSVRPSIEYMVTQLERNGLIGANPPETARRSKKAFDDWLRRALDWMRRQQGISYGVKTKTGTTVTTTKPKATARNPVIR